MGPTVHTDTGEDLKGDHRGEEDDGASKTLEKTAKVTYTCRIIEAETLADTKTTSS